MVNRSYDGELEYRTAIFNGSSMAGGEEAKPPKNYSKERSLRGMLEVCCGIDRCTAGGPKGEYQMRSIQVKAIMDANGGFLCRITAEKDGLPWVAFHRESTATTAIMGGLRRFHLGSLSWRQDVPMQTRTSTSAKSEELDW